MPSDPQPLEDETEGPPGQSVQLGEDQNSTGRFGASKRLSQRSLNDKLPALRPAVCSFQGVAASVRPSGRGPICGGAWEPARGVTPSNDAVVGGFENRLVLGDLQVEFAHPIADPTRPSDGAGELDVL